MDKTNDPPKAPSVKRFGKEIGASGTFIPSGIISQEEYNANITGQLARKVFDIMRRSDGTVHAALQACKLPILSVDFDIEPASDDAQDQYIAEFVEDQLFNKNVDYHSFIREALTMFDFGFSVFEKTYEVTDYEGKVQIGIKSIGSRKQRTILFWQLADGSKGIRQQLLGTSDGKMGIFEIPIDKLIIFTNEKEGENYEGISLLRFAYKDWDMKDKLGIVNAIALEKMSVGVPVLGIPSDANDTEKAKARASLRQFRANQEAYIELPAQKTDGWYVEMLDMKGNSVKDVLPTIEYHDKQILLSVLAQFLNLGSHGSGGSRAVSKDHSQLFMLSEEAAVKTLVSTIQRELIVQLVDLNFSDLPNGYPQLKAGRVADDQIETMAAAVNQLMTAGALTPDPTLETWVRDSLHAPDLPDELKDPETYKEAHLPPPPPLDPNKTPVDPSLDPNAKKPAPKPATKPDTKAQAIVAAKYAHRQLIDILVNE